MFSRQPRPEAATRPMARRKRRRRALAALALTGALIAGTAYGAWRYIDENEYLLDQRCEVIVAGETQRLSPEQAHNAALLSAAAADRGLPVEAAVHAAAISLQEADLELREDDGDAGDRVLFARGVGSWADDGPAEDTPISVDGFFDLLDEQLEAAEEADEGDEEGEDEEHDASGWEPEMPLDEAAEVLNRPHNPQFYPQHEDRARAFVSPLTGQSQRDLSCTLSQLEDETPSPDAEAAADELISTLPAALGIPSTDYDGDEDDEEADEFEPEPIPDGLVDLEGTGEDAVLTITYPSDPEHLDSEYDLRWMIAQWGVASAYDYGIQTVETGSHLWDRDDARWTQPEHGSAEEGTVRIGFDRDWDED
ncbi:hypothetical protein [Nesterenkonia populi]